MDLSETRDEASTVDAGLILWPSGRDVRICVLLKDLDGIEMAKESTNRYVWYASHLLYKDPGLTTMPENKSAFFTAR